MVSRGRLVDAACGASMCKIAGLKEEKVTEGGAVQSKWKKEKKSIKRALYLGIRLAASGKAEPQPT